jgi:hypothetical protein
VLSYAPFLRHCCLPKQQFTLCRSASWSRTFPVHVKALSLSLALTDNSPDHTSVSLCKAILGRISTADLMHLICSSNVSQTDLVEALYQALELLEKYKSESVSSWDIMGLAIEAYRHVMPPSVPCCVNIINPQKNRCCFKSWK